MKPIFLLSTVQAFKTIDHLDIFQILKPGTVKIDGGMTDVMMITPTQPYNTN